MGSPLETAFWSKCTRGRPDCHHVVVAERVNRSIHQLQCALREGDVAVGEEAPGPTCSSGVENEDPGMAWHELQHSHAGECEWVSVLV